MSIPLTIITVIMTTSSIFDMMVMIGGNGIRDSLSPLVFLFSLIVPLV